MAVEDADDLAGFFDADEFAETVVWTPAAGGDAVSVAVILSLDGLAAAGAELGVAGTVWTARVVGAVLPAGKPSRNDSFVAAAGTFRVRRADPDPSGAVYVCALEKPA